MQFHPVAYTVKLNIEMSMAEMIARIASDKNNLNVMGHQNQVATQLTKTFGTSKDVNWKMDSTTPGCSGTMGDITFNAKREVHVVVERRESVEPFSIDPSVLTKSWDERLPQDSQEDFLPLKDVDSKKHFMKEASDNVTSREREGGMGMTTKIWGPPDETNDVYL